MKCTNVEYIEENFDLCDLEIEGGTNNYVAEGVVVHNTWACYGYHPEVTESHIITSKGLSEKGLAFKINEANATNLYIRTLDTTAPYDDGTGGNVIDRATEYFGLSTPFYILGEIFGKKVQDLSYGQDTPTFRVFDIYVGHPGEGRYLNVDELMHVCAIIGVRMVPFVYSGPFSKGVMETHTSGKTIVGGDHIREGVVIKPVIERRSNEIGRVILKSVSEDYLLRKGGTEYN
jgi:RNA ligase (TIGR02306 family)